MYKLLTSTVHMNKYGMVYKGFSEIKKKKKRKKSLYYYLEFLWSQAQQHYQLSQEIQRWHKEVGTDVTFAQTRDSCCLPVTVVSGKMSPIDWWWRCEWGLLCTVASFHPKMPLVEKLKLPRMLQSPPRFYFRKKSGKILVWLSQLADSNPTWLHVCLTIMCQ